MNKQIIFPLGYLVLSMFMIYAVLYIVHIYLVDSAQLNPNIVDKINLTFGVFGLIMPIYLLAILHQLFEKFPLLKLYSFYALITQVIIVIARMILFIVQEPTWELLNTPYSIFVNEIANVFFLGIIAIFLIMIGSRQFHKTIRYLLLITTVVSGFRLLLFNQYTFTFLDRLGFMPDAMIWLNGISSIISIILALTMTAVIYLLFQPNEFVREMTVLRDVE